MATILPKKTGFENPMALDDEHHEALAADPSISQFPQGNTFGAPVTNSFGSTPLGGNSMSTGSFGAPSSGGFGGSTVTPQPQQQQN